MSNKFVDMTGRKFGYWTVIERCKNDKNGNSVWLCKCKCGSVKNIMGSYLRTGNSKSCGCYAKELNSKGRHFIDLTGEKFGKWTVISRIPYIGKRSSAYWLCKCDCGTTKSVSSQSLRIGDTKSCGCLITDKFKDRPLCPKCGNKKTCSHGSAWRCSVCGRRWVKVGQINTNKEKRENNPPCSFCNTKTMSSSGKYNYRCNSCGRVQRKPEYRIKYPKYFPPKIEESLNKQVLIL
jgi:tRNA(Ile2) C34 agmatinyltransferase TiaS